MIHKAFDTIGPQDIQALLENQVREGRTIDYKLILPGGGDEERAEFLADASSFANAAGGDLLFGVAEKEGVPVEIKGLPGVDLDAVIGRLDNLIRDGIEPRMPVQIRPIPGFSEGPVLLVHVPRSWASPHMVTFKNRTRFYTRNNAGKYQMDVAEIRSAFAMTEALPERIRRFRDDRLAKIIADQTPVNLQDGGRIVLHLVPLQSMTLEYQIDPVEFEKCQSNLTSIQRNANAFRFNVDGFLSYSGVAPDYDAYCQAFRKGMIEAVDADFFRAGGSKVIQYAGEIERSIVKSVGGYLDGFRNLQVPPPVLAMVSVLGASGVQFVVNHRHARLHPTPIDRDVVLLPDVLIEELKCDVPAVLRPLLDALWNASGFAGSPYYDDNGNWINKRG